MTGPDYLAVGWWFSRRYLFWCDTPVVLIQSFCYFKSYHTRDFWPVKTMVSKPSSLTLFVPKQVAVIVLMEIVHQVIITHAGISPTLFKSTMWTFICSLLLLHRQLGKHKWTPELVFGNPVWSGLLAPRALDRDWDWSLKSEIVKKTRPNRSSSVFCGHKTRLDR